MRGGIRPDDYLARGHHPPIQEMQERTAIKANPFAFSSLTKEYSKRNSGCLQACSKTSAVGEEEEWITRSRQDVKHGSALDYVVNEGAFQVCFEMEDEEEVIRAILKRGLRNSKLRADMERSHLINLFEWLRRFPDLAEAYTSLDEQRMVRR